MVEEGDVVIAPFRFSESEERKVRPCLVIDKTAVSVRLVCITSKKLVQAYETEVVLDHKQAASIGLSKASRLDFMKRDVIPIHEVRKIVGHISALPKCVLWKCFAAAKAAKLLNE